MLRVLLSTIAAAALLAVTPMAASAGSSSASSGGLAKHPQSDRYRGTAQVRGFRQRVGGFSYQFEDSLLNQNSGRSSVDGENRDQGLPFDNGFFFSSGANAHPSLNRSPYPN